MLKKRFTSLFLALAMVLGLSGQAFAAEVVETESSNTAADTLYIDGTNYTYEHDYSRDKRTITISNDKNSDIDVIIYDLGSSYLYLNGEIIGTVSSTINVPVGYYSSQADDGWEVLSSDSHKITWAEGTGTAAVLGALAVVLPSLGPVGIAEAIGMGALATLAASSSGGTLDLEISMFHVPPKPPTYRYVWTFTASTGDVYGPYSYMYA